MDTSRSRAFGKGTGRQKGRSVGCSVEGAIANSDQKMWDMFLVEYYEFYILKVVVI
jgi:hypothetical protein